MQGRYLVVALTPIALFARLMPEQFIVNQFAQEVPDGDMALLDARRVC